MKRLLTTLLVVSLVFVSSVLAQAVDLTPEFTAKETVVTFENFGQVIKGTLTMPEGTDTCPAVLIFHGFSGQRNEMDIVDMNMGMFTYTAKILAEQGIASLRIDFRGSGESEGEWADTTFSGQIADGIAALDFISSVRGIDNEKLGVLGLSQGGLVAASVAGRDSRVKVAILWSAVSDPVATYGQLLTGGTIEEALRSDDEVITRGLPWGATTSLKKPFFRDLFNVNPVAEISKFKGPLMVVAGLQDTVVSPQPESAEAFLKYHDGKEAELLLEADHMLGIFTSADPLNEAIGAAVAWFDAAFGM